MAGFGAQAEVDRDLVEWNYGDYEGLHTAEIHAKRPGWGLFRDGCAAPEANAASDVGARADRLVDRVRAVQQDILIFSSGHFLRVLAARRLGFEPQAGEHFLLSTASLSAFSYEDDLTRPVIKFWNDLHHLMHH